jgi:hypothetical protein
MLFQKIFAFGTKNHKKHKKYKLIQGVSEKVGALLGVNSPAQK